MPDFGERPLLMLIDPRARREDGEAVRVVRDVLGARARVKAVVPEGREALRRQLDRMGRRRPVVVGDDAALRDVVELLYRAGLLDRTGVAMVPVGGPSRVRVAAGLGVDGFGEGPGRPVRAARAVLAGVERRLDLVVDDGGAVVLGDVRARCRWPAARAMRVEADGAALARPLHRLTVVDELPDDGLIELRSGAGRAAGLGGAAPLRVMARQMRVTGGEFRYGYGGAAPAVGPVHARTWTVVPGAWALTVPLREGRVSA